MNDNPNIPMAPFFWEQAYQSGYDSPFSDILFY